MVQGVGIRATARGGAVAPNPILPGWREAAEPLEALPRSVRCAVHVQQLPLDELSTVIRVLQTGQLSEGDARERLEPSRPWVWTALAPGSQGRLALERGARPVELAQRGGPRGGPRFAAGGARWVSRWLPGGSACHGGPLGRVDATGAPPRQGPVAHAPLAAAAWMPLCTGDPGGPA